MLPKWEAHLSSLVLFLWFFQLRSLSLLITGRHLQFFGKNNKTKPELEKKK